MNSIDALESPRSRKWKRPVSTKAIPAELVGRWSASGSPFIYIFTGDGNFYVEGTHPFSITADGLTLDLYGTNYDRILGVGTSIEGVWSHYHASDNITEEVYYRTDSTYTTHWSDGLDFFGTYSVSGGKIAMADLHALTSTSGDTITFDQPYGLLYTGTFELIGNTLTIIYPCGTVVYTRVI